jgi:hypothetical protein
LVTYGIEAIGNFDLYNDNNPGYELHNLGGFPLAFCEKLDEVLSKHHHKRIFYWNEADVCEVDMNDRSSGGVDDYRADNVDLFLINTHGGHDENGNIQLYYNTKAAEWVGNSSRWKLGDKKLKWLMIHACETLERKTVKGLWHIFQGLHQICGSYGSMNAKASIGEDLGENLAEYFTKTIADAWIDGVGDTFYLFSNYPMVIAAERKETIDFNSKPGEVVLNWQNSTIDTDTLSFPVPDIPNSEVAWISIKWLQNYNMNYRTSSST